MPVVVDGDGGLEVGGPDAVFDGCRDIAPTPVADPRASAGLFADVDIAHLGAKDAAAALVEEVEVVVGGGGADERGPGNGGRHGRRGELEGVGVDVAHDLNGEPASRVERAGHGGIRTASEPVSVRRPAARCIIVVVGEPRRADVGEVDPFCRRVVVSPAETDVANAVQMHHKPVLRIAVRIKKTWAGRVGPLPGQADFRCSVRQLTGRARIHRCFAPDAVSGIPCFKRVARAGISVVAYGRARGCREGMTFGIKSVSAAALVPLHADYRRRHNYVRDRDAAEEPCLVNGAVCRDLRIGQHTVVDADGLYLAGKVAQLHAVAAFHVGGSDEPFIGANVLSGAGIIPRGAVRRVILDENLFVVVDDADGVFALPVRKIEPGPVSRLEAEFPDGGIGVVE